MDLHYRKGPLRYSEVWFNEVSQNGNWQDRYGDVDAIVFHESRVPVSPRSIPFRNGVVALKPDLDLLFAMFNSGFRNEVRRARKEGIVAGRCIAVDNIGNFYAAYARFCRSKNIAALSHALLQHYARARYLFVSEATLGAKAVQAHIYFAGTDEAMLLASFPLCADVPSKVMGWANRALHWADIVQFKEAGLLRCNLGGMGNPVTENNRAIVAFKNEMCPNEVVYYQDAVAVSLLGKCYFWSKKFMR
jgi:hypothetical protein